MTLHLSLSQTDAQLQADGQTRYLQGMPINSTNGFATLQLFDDPFEFDMSAIFDQPLPITFDSGIVNLLSVDFLESTTPDSIVLNFDLGTPANSEDFFANSSSSISWVNLNSAQETNITWANGMHPPLGTYTNPTSIESAYWGSQANAINPGIQVDVESNSIPEPSGFFLLLVVCLVTIVIGYFVNVIWGKS